MPSNSRSRRIITIDNSIHRTAVSKTRRSKPAKGVSFSGIDRDILAGVLLSVLFLSIPAGPVQADFVTVSASFDVNAQAMINGGVPVVNSASFNSPTVFNQFVDAPVAGAGSDTLDCNASQHSNVPSAGTHLAAAGFADLSSTIADGSTGSVYNLPPSSNNFPNSTVSILFSISTPQDYDALITLSSSLSGNPGLFANTDVVLSAYAPDNGYVFVASAPETNLHLTGYLAPGEYQLSAFSEVGNEAPLTSNEFVFSSFNVSMEIAPTPEPGTLVLLITAGVSIGTTHIFRRRQAGKAAKC